MDHSHLAKEDYFIAPISQALAKSLVEQHHYSKGGSNTAVYRHGLFHIDAPDICLGVAWWLPPTKVAAQSVHDDWRRVLSLTRLVVVPGVPTNGASFLMARSIREIQRTGDWTALVTYADEGQGHTGAIYKATNWTYKGIRPGHAVWVDSTGRHVAKKAGPRTRKNAEMLELGYTNTGATRKHKFVMYLKAVPRVSAQSDLGMVA